MSAVVKESQSMLPLEGLELPFGQPEEDDMSVVMDSNDALPTEGDLIILEEPEVSHEPDLGPMEVEIHVDDDLDGNDVSLTLDSIPGAADQTDWVEEPDDNQLAVTEEEEVVVDDDPWKWKSLKEFIPWLDKMMKGVPTHSGRDSAGLERAIAYLEALDKEISRAVRTDLNNEIAIDAVEKARDEIQRGLERLYDRLDKVKSSKYPKKKKTKKSEEEQEGLVKEAQKATNIGGIVITVPLLISGLARVCINGMVSAGHDIEDMFKKLSKKYELTNREKFELIQLLQDMNYPVRRDRGFLLDEEIDTSSSDNFDWAANYHA